MLALGNFDGKVRHNEGVGHIGRCIYCGATDRNSIPKRRTKWQQKEKSWYWSRAAAACR